MVRCTSLLSQLIVLYWCQRDRQEGHRCFDELKVARECRRIEKYHRLSRRSEDGVIKVFDLPDCLTDHYPTQKYCT